MTQHERPQDARMLSELMAAPLQNPRPSESVPELDSDAPPEPDQDQDK